MIENRPVVNTSFGTLVKVLLRCYASCRLVTFRYLVTCCSVTRRVATLSSAAVRSAPRSPPCLARDGHDVLVSDPDPAVVAAVRAGGLRVEGPAGSFTVAVPATAPDDLPSGLDGPVLVAVRARDTSGRGRAPGRAPGRRRVRRVPSPRPGRGLLAARPGRREAARSAAAARRRPRRRVAAAWADFDATELGPGVVRVGDRATLLVGELDNPNTERAAPARLPPPRGAANRAHQRLPAVRPGPGRGAGGHRSQRPAGRRGPGRSDLPAAAARGGASGAGRGGGAGGAVRRLRPRRPARFARPARTGQPAGRRTRTPRSTWTWRSGTARPTCPPLPAGEAAPC